MAVQKTELVRRYRRQRPSVRAARGDARAIADKWQEPQITGDLELLVSEVVTNAVIHGTTGRGSQVQVSYQLLDDRLRVEVRDAASGRPCVLRTTSVGGDLREYGRGLIVVSSLAYRWAVVPRVMGKSVWFEILLNKQAASDTPEVKHGA
ncbi:MULTISPECIES: ATP-binding protein [unclassified Streptomyces]|uniref:ATP-binding protein n=1 Tax=unclassified Streptomyces TaxID=2593676 RepID=UPI0003824CB8|nr:ATP-binding protein [Streptomyces sp. DpondAA-A50]MYR66657.1 ATP-binding protein [Streptomyces sp. SID4939]MYS03204.1 ATP-binding protein [Streptomyces sp. SID4940]MYT66903.1 ATP-binding protein [Streptomyces sp. SID8357]MYT88320.1 ATP-binding protein [Streptomyces sp. SID8360]MYW39511.1 ATP-binding protein [Streptomyces sp. SID1]